jgi:hypothetical protein
MSGPVFLFQIFIIAPLSLPRDIKLSKKYLKILMNEVLLNYIEETLWS